jgi:hypothetical protein
VVVEVVHILLTVSLAEWNSKLQALSYLVEEEVLDGNSGAPEDHSYTVAVVVVFADTRYHSLVVEVRRSRCREAAEREPDRAC